MQFQRIIIFFFRLFWTRTDDILGNLRALEILVYRGIYIHIHFDINCNESDVQDLSPREKCCGDFGFSMCFNF